VKRVALKYCGGCNPAYERVEYVRWIQDEAGAGIEWVTLDDDGFEGVLLINGCERACAERERSSVSGRRVVSITHRTLLPREIIALLSGRENNYD